MSFFYRNIGLGVFGYATCLMKMGYIYGSKEARAFTDKIFNELFRTAVFTSSERAKDLGSFPKYKECVFDSEIIKNHFSEEEIAELKKNGLRNCSLISVAPTGSIATMVNESTGCEPEFALKYTRRTVGLTDGEDSYYTVYCRAAREYIKKFGKKDLPAYFVESANVNWKDRILTQAVMQKHVDTAISSTVNLPQSATKEDVAQIYLLAWEKGLKGVTIFRDGCKRLGILTHDDKTTETPKEEELPRGAIVQCSNNLVGKKRKLTTGCGSLHCLAYFHPETGALQEVYLAKGSTGGCNNYMIALSRAISLLCRAGVSVYDIVDQLDSTGACPSYARRTATKHDTSKGSCCPMAVGNVLIEMYEDFQKEKGFKIIKKKPEKVVVKKEKESSDYVRCPECGEKTVREGGCISCKNCGWTKCE